MDLNYMNICDNQADCAFCGKMLIPIGLDYLCENYDREFLNYEKCGCEGANEYWIKKDVLKAKIEKKEKELELMKKFNLKSIRDGLQKCSFEKLNLNEESKYIVENIYEYLKEYLNGINKVGLIIKGDTNTRKTYISACIAKELVKNGQLVIMNRLNSLLEKIRETYNNDSVSADEIIELYSNIDMLIIDDFGTEKLTQWMIDKFYTILSNRIENNLPTIITTKFELNDLVKRLNCYGDYEMVDSIINKMKKNFMGIRLDGIFDTKEKVSTSCKTKC